MSEGREQCCICGRDLPNRWAVAGRCEAGGCGAAFCALHWHNGNRLCKTHGWKTTETKKTETKKMDDGKDAVAQPEAEIRERSKTEMTPQAKESVVRKVAAFAVTLGKGATSLVDRMRGVRDPDAAISALDAQLAANRERREPLAARSEKLYGEIAAKKKVYLAAPPARKKILELELKSLISEYQSLERQLAVYFENERVISTVRGRTLELTAMGLRKISEKDIDALADKIDDAAGDAEDVTGALHDLERSGKRRDSEDPDAFADALAGFDESYSAEAAAEPSGEAPGLDALAGFDDKPETRRTEDGVES